jgi:hypothetical protein
VVPLLLGVLVKRTPPWSAWSTVIVGFLSSLFITNNLTPAWAAQAFHTGHALDAASGEYWRQAIEMFGNVGICAIWFLGTKLAWRMRRGVIVSRVVWLAIFLAAGCLTPSPASVILVGLKWLALAGVGLLSFVFFRPPDAVDRQRVSDFVVRFNTPVEPTGEIGAGPANDARQERVVGLLCLAYGAFIALLALIPNPSAGRAAFVGCGSIVAAVGGLLLAASRRHARAVT